MNKLIFFRVPLECLLKDQVELIERSQITTRCDNEVSMDSQTITAQTQVSRPSNTSLNNAVSKENETIVELPDENNSLDDFVGNPASPYSEDSDISSPDGIDVTGTLKSISRGSQQQTTEHSTVESMLPTSSIKKENQCECPECGKILSNNFQLKRHLFFHRDKSEWPFECQICKEKARTKCSMSKHYLSGRHKKDPRFVL